MNGFAAEPGRLELSPSTKRCLWRRLCCSGRAAGALTTVGCVRIGRQRLGEWECASAITLHVAQSGRCAQARRAVRQTHNMFLPCSSLAVASKRHERHEHSAGNRAPSARRVSGPYEAARRPTSAPRVAPCKTKCPQCGVQPPAWPLLAAFGTWLQASAYKNNTRKATQQARVGCEPTWLGRAARRRTAGAPSVPLLGLVLPIRHEHRLHRAPTKLAAVQGIAGRHCRVRVCRGSEGAGAAVDRCMRRRRAARPQRRCTSRPAPGHARGRALCMPHYMGTPNSAPHQPSQALLAPT